MSKNQTITAWILAVALIAIFATLIWFSHKYKDVPIVPNDVPVATPVPLYPCNDGKCD